MSSITGVRAAEWIGEITDSSLRASVGVATYERGAVYAVTDQVQSLRASDDGRRVVAVVRGNTRSAYQTVVERVGSRGERRPVWAATCTCPVSGDCKHAVAVILAVRAQLDAAGDEWERVLGPLLDAAEHEPERDRVPVGLEVHLVSRRADAAPQVRIRPVRPTLTPRSSRWTAHGVSWADVLGTGGAWARPNPYRSDHRSLVAELHASRSAAGPAGAYGGGYGGSGDLYLGDCGPAVWSVLRRCLDAGIELLPGTEPTGPFLEQVDLADRPVGLAVDLSRPSQGSGAITMSVRVLDGDPEIDAETETDADDEEDRVRHQASDQTLIPLGRPVHGVARVTGSTLRLLPLAGTIAPVLDRLLTGGELRVPVGDADRFLQFYGPALARQVEVGSHDRSVQIEQPSAPVLCLEVLVEADHQIVLSLAIGYPTSGDSEVMVLGLDPGPDDPFRDLRAEADLIAGLHPLHLVPALLDRAARQITLRDRAHLRGPASVEFVSSVLPELRDRDDVQITVVGDLPVYAEADGAPVVHLEASDGEEGDWFDLHVSVTVDGQQVPFEPLFSALARGDETMLLESGTWFGLKRPELDALRRLIEEARELSDPDSRSLRLSAYQVGLWEDLVTVGVVTQQSRRWKALVADLGALGESEETPAGLLADLRPYQSQGYRWLMHLWDAGLGGVLADDMGLGKTLQALAMIQRAREQDPGGPPVLVVAPASVVPTWTEEAARFCPGLKVTSVTSTAARRRSEVAEAIAGADLVVTSYTLFRLEADRYRELPWAALILDEAQFVKNHQSKTYHAVRSLGAQRTFAITGTPLENSLMDLWAILSLAAPGLYPDPVAFGERYRKPIERGYGAEQLATLRRRIRPFLLRRTKDLVAPELPDRQEQVVWVPLAPAHQRIYSRHLQRERQRVLGMLEDMDRNRVAIFRALTALRQMSLDPGLVDEQYRGAAVSAKIETLLGYVREVIAEGHRALVFSTFTGYLELVRQALDAEHLTYSYLDGSTRNRAEVISGFRSGDDPLFLISLKAGGFGLTLTEADYVFLLDPWWNPAAEAQAIDRTHRIGQSKPVMVYRLVSRDTVEEKVMVLQERKRRLFSEVVDDGEFRSGSITADDIRGLLG